MNTASIGLFFKELGKEIFDVSYTLFKIMIPAIVIIKVLDMLGFTEYLGVVLAPLMNFVGLPESMGLVWATTIMTNIYVGILVFVDLTANQPLSIAQVSVLSGMMLIAHGLPLEGAIAKKAGVNIWVTLVARIGGGLLFGWLIFITYSYGDWLQQPSILAWQPEPSHDESVAGWLLEQGKNLLSIQLIIIVLLFFLKILKVMGVEKLMLILLQPLLRILGIGEKASTLTIIGITLGLSFGGGLLINEAKKGHIPARDIFTAMLLLGLLHSIIEDTLLMLLMGADINAILWGRILFTCIIIAIVTRVISRIDDFTFQKILYTPVHKS
ncbi:hypothetical protein A9Q99_25295 [Gammaproteobacteria bacterium 45_16_T64]|nr:hypothetical protein A9Q99_25295 [Gammaproteobacteria bacterium 45_16_T64]